MRSYASVAANTTSSSSQLQNTITTTTVIDINHPYFLSSSDHPGLSLVSELLTDHNYHHWSRSVNIALSAKLKLGFIDGTQVQPPAKTSLCGCVAAICHAYAMILQEENQRESASSVPLLSENAAMNVRIGTHNSAYKGKYSQFRKDDKKSVDSTISCEYCKLPGHVKDKCFALHGYPDWHLLYGQPKPKIRVNSNKQAATAHNVTHSGNESQFNTVIAANISDNHDTMTDAQCNQIIQMLQAKLKNPPAYAPWLQNTNSVAGSFSTNSVIFASPVNFSNSQNIWIIDSGATHYITFQLNIVNNPLSVNSDLQLPNGEVSRVTHIGNVQLNSTITLYDVLVVPSFQYNLLSIPQLTTSLSCIAYFSSSKYFLQDPVLKKVQEIGSLEDGLYKCHALSVSCHFTSPTPDCSSFTKWHCRLGHPSHHVLSHISCIDLPSTSVLFTCDVCHLSKHNRLPFPIKDSYSTSVFELVHCDVWAPTNTIPIVNVINFSL